MHLIVVGSIDSKEYFMPEKIARYSTNCLYIGYPFALEETNHINNTISTLSNTKFTLYPDSPYN